MRFSPVQKGELTRLLRSNRPGAVQFGELNLHFAPPALRNPRATLWCYLVGDEPPSAAQLVAVRIQLERDGSDVQRGQRAVIYGRQCGYVFTWLPNQPTDRR